MEYYNPSSFTARQLIRISCFTFLILGLIWYAVFQARNLIRGPEIMLATEPALVQHGPTVTLAGTTHNIVEMTLNGKTTFTDQDGAFEETLVLERGYTIMTLRAKDRYGRTVVLSRPFVYTPLPVN